jgi:hypothetical protein
MLTLMPNLPDHVVGLIASATVTASDYETVLVPAIESRMARHGPVRILYQLGPAFTGFTAGAIWDDLKLGVAHLTTWERVAVVTDVDWIAVTTRLFGFALPCPVKVFPIAEIAAATHWISEGLTPA